MLSTDGHDDVTRSDCTRTDPQRVAGARLVGLMRERDELGD